MTANADFVIGRDPELAVLAELAAEVAAGRGRSLLIDGEPGIGKSALLATALARMADTGECEVLRGQCDDLAQRFPLSATLRALGVDERSTDPRRAETARALSRPQEASGWSVRAVSGDPVMAAVEQLLALVDRLCTAGPVVLAMEDLQWADEATLLVWRRLCRATAQLPLLLIGTHGPVPQRAQLDQVRRELRSQGGALISLDRLASASVAALADRLAGGPPGPRLARRLELAAGNPLYVREMLDALSRADALRLTNGVAELAVADHQAAMMVSLAGVIADRLDFLSADTREVLRTAALLGPDFSVTDLATVIGRPAGAMIGVVQESLAAGVLEPVGARLRFRHGLLKQALYEAMPTALRAALHRQAAQALIATSAPVERVAQLILSALDAADGWELDWLIEHADALTVRAPAIAAELLEHALLHTGDDDPRHPDLQDQLAAVSFLLARYEQAERITRSILARTTDPQRNGSACWLLGYTLIRTGRLEEARALVGDATKGPRADPVWQARLSALDSMILLDSGRNSEASQSAARALADGERLADPTAMAYALHVRSLISHHDRAECITMIDRALAVSEAEPGLADLRLVLLTNRAGSCESLDRFDEAVQSLGQARLLAERTGTPRLAVVHTQAGDHAFLRGGWDDALAELEAGTELPMVHAFLPLYRHGIMALIAGHRDDRQSATRHLEAVRDLLIPPGWARSNSNFLLAARALAAERAGRAQQAVEVLAVLLTPEYERDMEGRSVLLPTLVRLALAAHDRPTAERAVLACRQDADRDPALRKLAAADWSRGLLDADPAPVLAAAAYQRTAGRLPDLGNALEDAAVLQAEAGDLRSARAVFAEAMAVYTELGAVWDSRRATARLRPYGIRRGVRGPRQRPQSGWQSLTATELRVAELVAQGRSNPDIAGRLLLSRRTVETHVSHILAKLHARSRREITDLVEANPGYSATAAH